MLASILFLWFMIKLLWVINVDIYDKYKNKKLVDSISDNFDIYLKKYKVYDQDDSLLCWIYAGCNTIKYDISKAINVDIEDIDISINYLSFYDRYEKINKIYDEIIYNDYDESNIKYLLFNYVNPYGDFNHFKYLVNKYGIVFENQMPMTENNYIPNDINNLLKQKIVEDIDELKSTDKLDKKLELKKKYMKELYVILSNIFGAPPKNTVINNINVPEFEINEFGEIIRPSRTQTGEEQAKGQAIEQEIGIGEVKKGIWNSKIATREKQSQEIDIKSQNRSRAIFNRSRKGGLSQEEQRLLEENERQRNQAIVDYRNEQDNRSQKRKGNGLEM